MRFLPSLIVQLFLLTPVSTSKMFTLESFFAEGVFEDLVMDLMMLETILFFDLEPEFAENLV